MPEVGATLHPAVACACEPHGPPPCLTSPAPSHVVVTGRQNSFRSLEGVAARTSTALERLADALSSRNVKRRVLGRWARAARDRKTARSLVKRWCASLAVWLLPRCRAVVTPIAGDVHSICWWSTSCCSQDAQEHVFQFRQVAASSARGHGFSAPRRSAARAPEPC